MGGSICTSITSSFVDESSQSFFRPTWDGLWLITYFSDFRFVDPFRRYSRSKSKVVRNRAKFWTVFWPSQISGGRPSKNCAHVITHGSSHAVWIKICDDFPISPEVVDVHTLNFKPSFKFSRLNFFGGTSIPVGVCAR